jgi:hypothetical protein
MQLLEIYDVAWNLIYIVDTRSTINYKILDRHRLGDQVKDDLVQIEQIQPPTLY